MHPRKKAAETVHNHWIACASASGIELLRKCGNLLAKYRHVSYWKHPITTGSLESVNNKIIAMSRQAYGSRNRAFFTFKIITIH
ncbi:transposase [bacterium]|nr:transposase [bacterium]